MRQTTRNLIRGVGVAAVMALPVSSLAVGISKAFGHPLLEEGRNIRPNVVASIDSVPSQTESKTSSERSGGRIVDLSGGIVPETQIETTKQIPQELSWKKIIFGVGAGLCIAMLVPVSWVRHIGKKQEGDVQ